MTMQEAIAELLESSSLGQGQARDAMGTAARALVERDHSLGRVADLYAAALEEAVGGGAVRDAVLGEVAGAAADVGIGAEDPEAAELARRLGEVGLAG